MRKIIFADQLRGVAAIAVVIVHLCGGFWAWREEVAQRIMAPVIVGPSSRLLDVVNLFNFGPFGVAIFFLISGFVIPMSLENLSPGRFLIARAFRIYPVYIVSLAIGLLAVWLSSRYWGTPFTLARETILSNAFLVHGQALEPSIDFVNWTLAIEVKFYIVMAAAALFGLHRRPVGLVAVSAAILAGVLVVPPEYAATTRTLCDLGFIPYMLVGTVFSMHMRGRINGRHALSSILALAGIFVACVFIWHVKQEPAPLTLDIYLPVMGVFAAAYAYRDQFRPNRLLDFLASISYPLYAVHCLLSFVLLRVFLDRGIPHLAALPATLIVIVVIAYGLHRLVEKPTNRVGKWIVSNASRLQTQHHTHQTRAP
ncbi:acyltransferase family protein [Burkholderia territorii]|uniref:acyltransferase family protein n=1 Tax=Burkholderia territorii TaxID=1503055 RepID=UPI0022AAAB95|nr:acyltransferase [Burkholderia territorii]